MFIFKKRVKNVFKVAKNEIGLKGVISIYKGIYIYRF